MKTTSRRFTLALVIALALTLATIGLAACGSSGGGSSDQSSAAAAPFKVGVAGPMTGQYATYGASHKAGAELAMDELNAAGGVNGAQVSLSIGDDLGDPKEAVLVAQKFIDDSSIVVVDGHQFSGATIAAGAKYQAAGLPMITPSATQPDITDLGDYIWRICMTDAVQGKGLADYSVNTLGKKNIAIMYDNSDYGRGLADAFESGVKDAGGTVADREQYTTGDTDFKAQLTKIKAANPDLLFLSGYYPEGSKIAQQARELGLTVQMLGSDGYASDQLPKLGGAAVEGMLVSTFFDYTKQDPAVQKFVTAYKAKHDGANPDWFVANSYDVVMLAAKAAQLAGKNDRTAINDALAKIGTYQGVSGPITFDQNGDVVKPLSIV
ncbi:MAG TPA: ABC transporter substrate-binding protein, partial [Thermoleophilia bacterium]|nr:ABC transporter substrate-binding protein [Thermoleophilia bacterium]